jgi:hypothetical protein
MSSSRPLAAHSNDGTDALHLRSQLTEGSRIESDATEWRRTRVCYEKFHFLSVRFVVNRGSSGVHHTRTSQLNNLGRPTSPGFSGCM